LLPLSPKAFSKSPAPTARRPINVSQRKAYVFVQMNGKQEKFKLRSVKQIVISGRNGNDDIETIGKLPA